jgi:antitoxin component YwqK of YwqJK toxin-antitoxin module
MFENLSDASTKAIGATINGKKQGLWICYNDSGQVSYCEIYINDSLTGESIGYLKMEQCRPRER